MTDLALRGGSWILDCPSYFCVVFKYWLNPDLRNDNFGFRVTLGPQGNSSL